MKRTNLESGFARETANQMSYIVAWGNGTATAETIRNANVAEGDDYAIAYHCVSAEHLSDFCADTAWCVVMDNSLQSAKDLNREPACRGWTTVDDNDSRLTAVHEVQELGGSFSEIQAALDSLL